MSKSGSSPSTHRSRDEKRSLATLPYGIACGPDPGPLRPGITSITLAQPSKKSLLNTQWPAVSTVRGPMNHPVPIAPAPFGPRMRNAQIIRHGARSVSSIRTRSSRPMTVSNGGRIGPLFPLTARWRSDRDTSLLAVPGRPAVIRAGAAAARVSNGETGLLTDVSSIMNVDLPGFGPIQFLSGRY